MAVGLLGRRVTALIALALATLMTAAAETPTPRSLDGRTKLFTFGNGCRLIVQEARNAPLVAVDIWVAAGSSRETNETNGCAHFLEHLIFKGSARQGRGALDRVAEGYGAMLDAVTDRDWSHFSCTVGSRFWEPLFTELADAVLHPALIAEDVDTERRVILDEIARKTTCRFAPSSARCSNRRVPGRHISFP